MIIYRHIGYIMLGFSEFYCYNFPIKQKGGAKMRRKNVKKITAMAMSVLMAALTLGSVSSFAAEGTSSEIADEALE